MSDTLYPAVFYEKEQVIGQSDTGPVMGLVEHVRVTSTDGSVYDGAVTPDIAARWARQYGPWHAVIEERKKKEAEARDKADAAKTAAIARKLARELARKESKKS